MVGVKWVVVGVKCVYGVTDGDLSWRLRTHCRCMWREWFKGVWVLDVRWMCSGCGESRTNGACGRWWESKGVMCTVEAEWSCWMLVVIEVLSGCWVPLQLNGCKWVCSRRGMTGCWFESRNVIRWVWWLRREYLMWDGISCVHKTCIDTFWKWTAQYGLYLLPPIRGLRRNTQMCASCCQTRKAETVFQLKMFLIRY